MDALRFAVVEDCPPLVAVVFPAILSAYRAVKVFIGPQQAWVAADSPSGPQVVETLSYDHVVAYSGNTFDLVQADGSSVQVRQGGGCGCGSKLRSYSPFTGPVRVGT